MPTTQMKNASPPEPPKHIKRILLKISGESLGEHGAGVAPVVVAKVAAQDRPVDKRVTLVRVRHPAAGKTAYQSDAVGKIEGGRPIAGRLPDALVRPIRSIGHMNLVGGDSYGQRILQMQIRRTPGRRVMDRARCVSIDVNNPGACRGGAGPEGPCDNRDQEETTQHAPLHRLRSMVPSLYAVFQ